MERRMRVMGAATALLAVSAVATGCGLQHQRGTAIELTPVSPSPSAATPSTGGSSQPSPATSQECFEVAELFSGVELLPLTDQAEDETTDDDALDHARAAADRVRGQLPSEVQPAFDEVRSILDGAGETLQPGEAAKIHRALDPAEAWLQSHCTATARPGPSGAASTRPGG